MPGPDIAREEADRAAAQAAAIGGQTSSAEPLEDEDGRDEAYRAVDEAGGTRGRRGQEKQISSVPPRNARRRIGR